MLARSRHVFVVSGLAAFAVAQADRPPSRTETRALVAEYLSLDGRNAEGHSRRAAILARLDALPPLAPREIADWRKRIEREHRKGVKLEKGGSSWFWEDAKTKTRRGLYYVGGETARPKAILIGMHGGGVGSGDASSSHAAYSSAAKKLGWVSICPEVLEKTEHGWTDAGTEEFVLDLLDAALRTWDVDADRVYFTGHSMGGYGAWTLGAHHADRAAGLAPSAGAPTPILGAGGVVTGVVEGVIPSLRNVRMVVFQSTDDPRVPPGPNQKAVELVSEARQRWGGFDCEYWEVHDRGHGFPEGGAIALLEKMTEWRRNPVPERVTWQPVVRWKRQFYWLHWEDPFTHAIVVADVDRASNAISVTCDQSRGGLSVLLDERLVDLERDVVIRWNGAEVFRGRAPATLSTMVMTGERPDPSSMFVARVSVVPPG